MPAPARILVTGSRDWPCHDLAASVLARLMVRYGPGLVVVHGDCPTGVDRAFREACEDQGVAHEPHPADWAAHGKGAGPRRNAEMVDLGASLCVAVSRDLGKSRGTADCVRRAIDAQIPTCLIENEAGEPRWITKV